MNTGTKDFVMSRHFNAPRDLVWKAFTDIAHIRQWWGPKGFTVLKAAMDLRPGGTYHYAMKSPDGVTMWGKFVYREIVPQQPSIPSPTKTRASPGISGTYQGGRAGNQFRRRRAQPARDQHRTGGDETRKKRQPLSYPSEHRDARPRHHGHGEVLQATARRLASPRAATRHVT
jgi:hypothetical protein